MKARFVSPIFVGCTMVGCSTSMFTIYKVSKDNKLPGIPFYLVKGRLKQITDYTRSWIELTISFKNLSGKLDTIPNATIYLDPNKYVQDTVFSKLNQTGDESPSLFEFTKLFEAKLSRVDPNIIIDYQTLQKELSNTTTDVHHVLENLVS